MTGDEQGGGWVDPWALLALWILFVTVFLCVKGYLWGLVFLPFLALDLWRLRSLRRYAQARPVTASLDRATTAAMPVRLYFTNSDEANELIAKDPMALLLGFALDQRLYG
jgi:hypothetical protein